MLSIKLFVTKYSYIYLKIYENNDKVQNEPMLNISESKKTTIRSKQANVFRETVRMDERFGGGAR